MRSIFDQPDEVQDYACRVQYGFGQGDISATQPSQATYGVKSVHGAGENGCTFDSRRYECAMGYSIVIN